MAHNPPRVWMTDDDMRAVYRDAERKLARWVDLDELADKMMARAVAGERVVLSSGTAEVVARALKSGMK